jgi:hypothetical protein
VVWLPAGVYQIARPVLIRAGVTLRGDGPGNQPLQTQLKGSTLVFCGSDAEFAVQLVGHYASLRDVQIYGGSTCLQAAGGGGGGVLVNATAQLLESIAIERVLVYQFMAGAALTLQAGSSGGIGYALLTSVRVRHAATAVRLVALDAGSFVNSNQFTKVSFIDFLHTHAYSHFFLQLTVSGGITDYGILVEGPGSVNNNVFHSGVVEPYSTKFGHLVVRGSKSNVELYGCRFEASAQAARVPIMILDKESRGNVFEGGLVGHSFVAYDATLNPRFDVHSGKMAAPIEPGFNALFNPHLSALNANGLSDGCSLTGSGAVLSAPVDQNGLYPGFSVVTLTAPAGATASLVFAVDRVLPRAQSASAGVFVQSTLVSNSNTATVLFTMRGDSGVQSSGLWAPPVNTSDWAFVGLEVAGVPGVALSPTLVLDNTGGSTAVDINVTAPVAAYGGQRPVVGAVPLLQSGGVMAGVLTSAVRTLGAQGSSAYVLPVSANVFKFSEVVNIARINYSGTRFPVGTVITLVFQVAGSSVTSSAFIALRTSFSPGAGGVLGLVTLAGGLWQEVWRAA